LNRKAFLKARTMPARLIARSIDITTLAVDAIVNAANASLLGGGGVDGAIHRAAGPDLRAECAAFGGCPTGKVRLTRGYRLPARYVIHAVGPVWHGGRRGEPELLASCYRNALHVASAHGLARIAFPAISCGAYGYPLAEATAIAVREAGAFTAEDTTIAEVIFACFGDAALDAYRRELAARGI
jgi:O-acetyl-ADP-ribose deacetylase (regulator of RNase III)